MREYPEGESGWLFDIILVILFSILCWIVMMTVNRYLDRDAKAAYLEGRYGFDSTTAWQIAGE